MTHNRGNPVVFEHMGYPCVISDGGLVGRNGYVGVPKEHPLYKVEYDERTTKLGKCEYCPDVHNSPDDYLNVHGGITYSAESDPVGVYENWAYWFFGFDTGHSFDNESTRNDNYVASECRKLAEQLRKLDPRPYYPVKMWRGSFLRAIKT